MENNEIREAILKKARDEAEQIKAEAGQKAEELIAEAKEQKKKLAEEEKERKLAEARREAARILAQADLKERQIILGEKDSIIKDILKRVREELNKSPMEPEQAEGLLDETLNAFEFEAGEKIRIFVAPKDREVVKNIVDSRDDLKNRVVEVKEKDMMGGMVAETEDGMISIDNSYERRLEMLMPKILPEIGNTLFGG